MRHGESIHNRDRTIQGHLDSALSPLGHVQAELLVARLVESGLQPAAVYTSPLRRARETASYVQEAFQLPLTEMEGLMEMGLGRWEGKKIEEVKRKNGSLLSRWLVDPSSVVIEEAEDFFCFLKRVTETFQRILQLHSSEEREIIIITHGGVLSTFICHSLDIPLRNIWCLKIDNASINRIVFHEKRVYLTCLNDTGHLKDRRS